MFEERKRELEEVKVVFRQYASITHVKDVRQQPSKLMNLFDAKCAIISLTGMDDDQIPLKSLKAQLSLIRKNFGERETTVVERTGRTSAINLIEFYHLYRHYKEKQLLISCCASVTLLEANNSCRNEGSSIALFDVQILYPHIDKRGKGWVTKDQIDQLLFGVSPKLSEKICSDLFAVLDRNRVQCLTKPYMIQILQETYID